jgi:hypothetical protein
MKYILFFVLSGLFLFGCSKKPAHPAIAFVEDGHDVTWNDLTTVSTLHVTKHEGASIEGIRLTEKHQNGVMDTITADKGSILCGVTNIVFEGIVYTNACWIDIYDPTFQFSPTNHSVKTFRVLLHE